MKKYLEIIVVLTIIFSGLLFSCSDDDEVEALFDKPVDQRVNETLMDYKTILVSSEFGWKVDYQTTDGLGVYKIHLKFNTDDTVIITSDAKNGVDDLPTNYRIGISQFPELVFENFSTFNSLFENGGGFDLGGEFEMLFEDVSADEVVLRSKTDAEIPSTITFVKASATDVTAIAKLRGLDARIEDGYNTDLFFRTLQVFDGGGVLIETTTFSYAFDERIATINSLGANGVTSAAYPLELTENGFRFLEPVTIGGVEFQEFVYNETENTFVAANGNGGETIVTHSATPGVLFYPEVNTFGTLDAFEAYLYFDNTSGNFLTQTSDDFLNLGLSSGISRIQITFNDLASGGINYFLITMSNGDTFFLIFETEVIPNERMIFNFAGQGSNPPDLDFTPLIDLASLLLDSNGWYIERTDESRFASNPSYLLTSAIAPNFRFSVYGL